jgi:cold shock CspA family protein
VVFCRIKDATKYLFNIQKPEVTAAGIRALNEDDSVSFILENDPKGRGKQAGQLKIPYAPGGR